MGKKIVAIDSDGQGHLTNCDSLVFLGGNEKTTLKDLSEVLGKETIDMYNISDTRGMSPSYGTNYQKTGKDDWF